MAGRYFLLRKLLITCIITLTAPVSAESLHYFIVDSVSRPFQITEDNQSKGGIVSDIISEVFANSEYQVEHDILPLKRIYLQMAEHKYKNWIAYDSPAWNSLAENGEMIQEPLFEVTHSYLTCHPQPELIQSAEDIANKSIAIIKNFDYPQLSPLAEEGKLNLIPVEGYKTGLQLVKANHVDAFVEMTLRLKYNQAKEHIAAPCMRYVDFSALIPAYTINLSLSKTSSPELKKFVNDRVLSLKRSGRINEIVNSYLAPASDPIPSQDTPSQDIHAPIDPIPRHQP